VGLDKLSWKSKIKIRRDKNMAKKKAKKKKCGK